MSESQDDDMDKVRRRQQFKNDLEKTKAKLSTMPPGTFAALEALKKLQAGSSREETGTPARRRA